MLPVEKHKEEIEAELLKSGALVFTAPPGSGKSTMLPLFLSEMNCVKGEVVVLQPRRLAARMLAHSVAKMNGLTLGNEVGYQVRGEKKLSKTTAISYRTDGLFLRQLIENPDLIGIGAVVLDEFHERTWQSDLILSFLKKIKQNNPELKIVVMSATMETEKLCNFLDCSLVQCEARLYPVEIYYKHFNKTVRLWDRVQSILKDHLSKNTSSGDILVFMPGVYEINKTIDAISHYKNLSAVPLHGSMPPDKQDAALRKSSTRKVIVCTNIAETSLTVEGVDTVIDAGYSRVSRFDVNREINMLNLEPIPVFSAEQRAGRAGRLGPGICYRLWSREEHSRKPIALTPDVLRSDLSEVLIQILKHKKTLENYEWYEKPEETQIEGSLKRLEWLGAVKHGELTKDGRDMASFPCHPTISRFLIEAQKNNCFFEACYWAAILSEQSPIDKNAKLSDKESPASDIGFITNIWSKFCSASNDSRKDLQKRYKVKGGVIKSLNTAYSQLSRLLNAGLDNTQELRENVVRSLLKAYSHRLAVRVDRGTLRYRFANSKVAELSRNSSVRGCEFIIASDVVEINTSGSTKLLISNATVAPYELLEEIFLDELDFKEDVSWNESSRSADYCEIIELHGLVLRKQMISRGDATEAQSLLLAEKVLDGTLKINSWNSEVSKWIQRVKWVGQIFPEKNLLSYSDDDIKQITLKFCTGCKTYKEIKNVKVLDYFKNALSWDDQQFVQAMTPDRVELSNGKRVKVKYEDEGKAKISGFIQDFYGVDSNPEIAQGRIKVQIEMLAPNRRPVHLTEDLEGFWDGVYKDIKSQLAGRYPKHKWI